MAKRAAMTAIRLGRPMPRRGEDYGPERDMLPSELAVRRAREILEMLRERANMPDLGASSAIISTGCYAVCIEARTHKFRERLSLLTAKGDILLSEGETPVNRRLAAILVADVVGYSRLMAADEADSRCAKGATEGDRRAARPRKRRADRQVHGRWRACGVPKCCQCVEAARSSLQKRMAEANADLPEERQIRLRIGINLGEVVGEGTDIFGDGVNIAARLEAMAEPSGICISGKVQEEVRGKVDCAMEDMGEQTLKNIDRPVRAYRVRTRTGEAGPLPAEDCLHEAFDRRAPVRQYERRSGATIL